MSAATRLAWVFSVRPCPEGSGRWLVCRPSAGRPGVLDVVESCPSFEAAQRECAWQQAEHERDHLADRHDARLRGAHRTPGVRA